MADVHHTQKASVPQEDHNVGEVDDPSPLKRQSSGIGSIADEALEEYQNEQKAQSQDDHDDPDRRSFDKRDSYDSGLDPDSPSPFPASPKVSAGPKSGVGHTALQTDQLERHKLLTTELKTKMNRSLRVRSRSQGEIQGSTIYETDEQLEKDSIFKKNVQKPVGSVVDSKRKPRGLVAKGPLQRARTLPTSPKHKQGNPTSKSEENQETITPPSLPTDKKSKSGLKKQFKQITRSISTRIKSKSKPKLYYDKHKLHNSTDNLLDSEYPEKRKPSPLRLQSARLSRSLDDFTDGYDLVGVPYYGGPRMPPKTEGFDRVLDIENTEGEPAYEKFTFDTNLDESKCPLIDGVGLVQTDGDKEHVERDQSLVLSQCRLLPTPKKTQSVKKPIPVPRQHNAQKQPNLPPPLPPPTAKENTEMAEKAIHNIMKEHPEAEMTEIVIQTTHFVAKYCDENGGFLEVGSKVATLLVPPYALEKPTFIYVQIEESHCFIGRQDVHQIAPVVHCGTPGTQFSSPVILTLLTSVKNADYLDVAGLRKKDVENQQEDWKGTSENGGKVISTDNGKCVLMLNHFTGDTAAAKPKEQKHFAEICFAAFTSPVMGDDMIFDIRVWMSSNNEWFQQNIDRELQVNRAKKLGHFNPTMYIFEKGGDVSIKIKNLHRGWGIDTGASATEVISIRKLQYDHLEAGIRESRVFRIRPHGEFIPKEAVDFNIAIFQNDNASHEVKIQVHVIPEVKQTSVRPGQHQPYRVSRQAVGWKPTKEKFGQLKQSLSTDDRKWLPLAAWLHLNIPDFDNLPCPVSAMVSQLCSKHASSKDYMRRAIEDLEEPLQKLGSKYQEASDIVKDMLTSGTLPRPEGTDVILRQPVQDTWPSFNPHQPIHTIPVNEYRYNPYQYRTLSSVDQYEDRTLEARQVTQRSLVEQEQVQGARPKTLRSDGNIPTISHSAPAPIQQVWPPEQDNQNPADHNDNNLEADANSLIPKGVERRKSSGSGYCTIGEAGIDPNRPRVSIPNAPEYHYDQPVHSPEAGFATGITNAPLVNHLGNDDYDVVLHPSDMAKTQQGSINQIQPSVEVVDVQALSRGDHPEPQYMNMLQDHRKPNMKGYVKISKEVN